MVKWEKNAFTQSKQPNESPLPIQKTIEKPNQESVKQIISNQNNYPRKPLQDITNVIQHHEIRAKKQEKSERQEKFTKKYAYLTFLNRNAEKKYRTLLFVDRELNFPKEYQIKLQNHICDNDADSDDEQILKAVNQLKYSLFLESDKQKQSLINSCLQNQQQKSQ